MSVLVTRSCRALGVGITEGFFYLKTFEKPLTLDGDGVKVFCRYL